MSVGKVETVGIEAVGAINGVNRTFVLSEGYLENEIVYVLNGQMKREDFDDGFVQTSPIGGIVDVNEAPKVGDVVQFMFVNRDTSNVVVLGEPLFGVLGVPAPTLAGEVVDNVPTLQGTLSAVDVLSGSLDSPAALLGELGTADALVGVLRVCV